MIDRKKVIQGLTVCTDDSTFEDCRKCPYQGEDYCTDTVMTEALALLREQEPVRFKVTRQRLSYPFWDAVCSGCGYQTSTIHVNWKYCPECGRRIEWDA